jgi:hypothetical protein
MGKFSKKSVIIYCCELACKYGGMPTLYAKEKFLTGLLLFSVLLDCFCLSEDDSPTNEIYF